MGASGLAKCNTKYITPFYQLYHFLWNIKSIECPHVPPGVHFNYLYNTESYCTQHTSYTETFLNHNTYLSYIKSLKITYVYNFAAIFAVV